MPQNLIISLICTVVVGLLFATTSPWWWKRLRACGVSAGLILFLIGVVIASGSCVCWKVAREILIEESKIPDGTISLLENDEVAEEPHLLVPQIEVEPQLCFSTSELNFGTSTTQLYFDIWNCGTRSVEYSIETVSDWVEVSPMSGSSSGERDQITVSLTRSELGTGHHETLLYIEPSSGETAFIIIHAEVPKNTVKTETSLPNILFFDDFERGRSSAWRSTLHWEVSHDRYCYFHGEEWGYSYVMTGIEWEDYAVEADIELGYDAWAFEQVGQAAFILRAQRDLKSMVIVYGGYDEIKWAVRVAGAVVETSRPITPGFFAGQQHVRVEVVGNTYRLYVDGILRSEFTDSHFQTGMPGVASFSKYSGWTFTTKYDNFKVVALPD